MEDLLLCEEMEICNLSVQFTAETSLGSSLQVHHHHHLSSVTLSDYIVAYRPVARQRLQNKQLCNSHC
jgi:hypothetical protein